MSLVAAEAMSEESWKVSFWCSTFKSNLIEIYSVRAYRGLRFNKEYAEKLAQKRQREKEKRRPRRQNWRPRQRRKQR